MSTLSSLFRWRYKSPPWNHLIPSSSRIIAKDLIHIHKLQPYKPNNLNTTHNAIHHSSHCHPLGHRPCLSRYHPKARNQILRYPTVLCWQGLSPIHFSPPSLTYTQYTCYPQNGNLLCPITSGIIFQPCGQACFDPANYGCKNGQLVPVGKCNGQVYDKNSVSFLKFRRENYG